MYPDDPVHFQEGAIIDGLTIGGDISDIADYVVIGSGAAGATAAYVLSSAGYSVILLEEGSWVRTPDFGADVFPAMKTLFRDMGANMTVGKAMFPVLQGSCVGGSTTINSAIAWRAPEHVIRKWGSDFGLKEVIDYQKLEEHYTELDRSLQVRPVDDSALGRQSALFGEAALKLGIKAERMSRYDGGCDASASCLTGCRSGKKLSMNVTYVPEALKRGAKIYTSTRALKIHTVFGRSVGVRAITKSRFIVEAKARRGVIVAASAVQTPSLLRKSGIKAKALGKNFQAHPGSTLTAKFDQPVSMQMGATQGYQSSHFIDRDRFKIETLSLPPEMLALRIPGVGPKLMENLLNYDHALNSAVVVRSEALGKIVPLGGKNFVFYSPTPTDMSRMRRGLKTLSEMMFSAGAREVWPGVHGVPTLKGPDDLRHWDQATLDPRAYGMMISHLFGSARMGPDPRTSVVGLDFQVHGVRGLYVLDSSIFPTNLGVNPQHTIMAVARLGASMIANRPLFQS